MKEFKVISISLIVIILFYLNSPKLLAINLKRFISIDYSLLKKYLESNDFQQANQETDVILGKVIGIKTTQNTSLLKRDINRLPCIHLKKIDELWSEHSDGNFGLVTQAKTWESLGGQLGIDDSALSTQFEDIVGWTSSAENYNLGSPKGHLPSGILTQGVTLRIPYIAKRLKECKIY